MSTPNGSPLDELKSQATEAVRKVGDKLNDRANVLRDTAAGARYDAQVFIESNPWQAVALAAAVGFLFGAIVSRATR
jgi:ElaB/YqjD/DUF883 family membrane-anchored ribosome-binding protein